MLRRSLLQLAYRSSVSRFPLRATTQIPSYLSSRRAYSVSPKNGPQKLNQRNNVPETQSGIPKILIGGLALGSALGAAYYYGALDEYIGKQQQSIREYTNAGIGEKATETSLEKKDVFNQASGVKQDIETLPEPHVVEESTRNEEGKSFKVKDDKVETPQNVDSVEERDIPKAPQISSSSDDEIGKLAEKSYILKGPEVEADEPEHKSVESTATFTSADSASIDIERKPVEREQTESQDIKEVVQSGGTQKSDSLLGDYFLKDSSEEIATSSSESHKDTSSKVEDAHEGYISKDGKLVLDFLQAIHAAEERQAEMDFRSFEEEKRAMKEKYEKELKDARVRELMYAEREAILDKELTKERIKAAAALKSLQEKLEEQLKTELEQKEMETEQRLKEMQDIAKAELAAALASEKASQIEKMAEANIHINALCMAFFARSEEVRESHSVHKLALGALALEDALSKGLPIENEVGTVRDHLEGIDKDSLIALVLSSLPEDTQKNGTYTLPQLNHKFDAMKGTLRHFSLIPQTGGGILSHSLAQVASWLKVKEADQSGEGVESLINRVDSLLAQGKLCEAADTLENGVKGSQAAEVVSDWIRRARDRAITEQALTILQSYATSISLT